MARPKLVLTVKAAPPRQRYGEGHDVEPCARQDEIGGIAPNVGGRGRRHGDRRSPQGRRVVDAVADHQHVLARLIDGGELVGRGQSRLPVGDADLLGERRHRTGAVAGDQASIKAKRFDRGDHFGCVGTGGIGKGEGAQGLSVAAEPDRRIAALGCVLSSGEAGTPEAIDVAIACAFYSHRPAPRARRLQSALPA